MKFGYTISSLKSLSELPKLDLAQFTLNMNVFPSKRKCVDNLIEMEGVSDADIYIHYDYLYIISRYILFSDFVKKAIISEIKSILEYSLTNSKIKGIVIHSDYPLSRSVYKSDDYHKVMQDSYNSSIWNKDLILELLSKNKLSFLEDSVRLFASDLFKVLNCRNYNCKIYIENTTKLPLIDEKVLPGSLESIISLFKNNLFDNPEDNLRFCDLFGICVDTEHYFAVTGKFPEVFNNSFNYLYHLNTIPKEVKPFSGKDLHSSTTMFECSFMSFDDYVDYISTLENNKIAFIREVKYDTMMREIDKIKSLC